MNNMNCIKSIRNIKNTKVAKEKFELGKISKILLLSTPLFLSGCTGMNSRFDCNIRPDGKCAPMGTIHKMADFGEFNEGSTRKITEYNNLVKAGRDGGRNGNNIEISNSTNVNNKYPRQKYFSDASSIDHLSPPRSIETIQKIWIGPYEDDNGNYHEASNVYAVIKKARWLAESEQTIKD